MTKPHPTFARTLTATFGFALFAMSLTSGCVSTHPTARPNADIEPLEEHSRAAIPDPALGPGREARSGRFDDRHWAHLNGIVVAEVGDICARLTAPESVVNERSVDSYSVRMNEDDLGFVLVNRINRRVIDFTFELNWKIFFSEDNAECTARWDLTLGPSFLRVNRGWIRASYLDEALSLVEMQHELGAPRIDEDQLERYLQSVLDRLAAVPASDAREAPRTDSESD